MRNSSRSCFLGQSHSLHEAVFISIYTAFKGVVHHFPNPVRYLGAPRSSPLYCVRGCMCSPSAWTPPGLCPSFHPHGGSFHPHTIHSLSFTRTGLSWLFLPDQSFTPLLLLSFPQWEDKQRWGILLLYHMLLIALICRQLQNILKLLVLPALYLELPIFPV